MNSENEKILESLRDLLGDQESLKLIKISTASLKCSKRRCMILLLMSFCLLIPLWYIGSSSHTIDSTIKIIQLSNDVIIPIFAMLFTGYALFQALVGGNTLKKMLIEKINNASAFKTYNLYFFSLAIYFLCIIILNFILLIVFENIPPDWAFPYLTQFANSVWATLLLLIYVIVNVNALIEVKSFLYNLYQCFSINAYANVITSLGKEDKTIGF